MLENYTLSDYSSVSQMSTMWKALKSPELCGRWSLSQYSIYNSYL